MSASPSLQIPHLPDTSARKRFAPDIRLLQVCVQLGAHPKKGGVGD